MDKEKEKRLKEDFPELFRERDSSVGRWGLECDNGWYSLIEEMCRAIEAAALRAGLSRTSRDWPRFSQVKEKFGLLRAYLNAGPTNKAIHAVDFIGLGSVRVRGEEPFREIYAAVRDAEERSAQICERCGRPGSLRTHRPWIQTLCDRCSQDRDREYEDQGA